MADASQSFGRFRRTRSVSLSGDAEFVRPSAAATTTLYTGRKSSDYCGTQERWISRLSLHHEFTRTSSSNCIDRYRYRDISRAVGDRNSLLRLFDVDGVLHLNCLPDDCLEHIFSFLTISERGSAAQVMWATKFIVKLAGRHSRPFPFVCADVCLNYSWCLIIVIPIKLWL